MKKIKKTIPYIINILLCILIFLISLKISNSYPFGNLTIGKYDTITQFKPMLYNWITCLKEGILESYSFNNGLGNPTIFNFLYYLASPLNLIAILFKDANAMYLSVILLKIACTAITITFYTRKKIANNYISAIATISYVFASWFIAYYYYLPWLDIFMIFPLFNYGLEKIVNNESNTIYILTLCYIVITNYSLSFSIIIYTIISYITNMVYHKYNKEERKQSFLRLILATGISILFLFAYLYILKNTYTKINLYTNSAMNNYTTSTFDLFKSIFYGNISYITDTTEAKTYPNIALNTCILLNTIYYFFNKKISPREKTFAFSIIVLCILPICINYFDFALNFFHSIHGFTYRYSFIYNFLSILLFIRNCQCFDKTELKKYHYISIPILLLLLIEFKNMDFEIFILNLVFLMSGNILIYFYNPTKLYKGLLLIVLITETALVMSNHISTGIEIKDENIPNDFNTEPILYRQNRATSTENKEYLNRNLYTNSNVTYLMTEMTYNDIIYLLGNLGCTTNDNTTSYCTDENQIFSMLFNVKNNNKEYLEKIYAVNKDIQSIDLDEYSTKNSLEYLVEAMTGITDIFEKHILIGEEKEGNYYYTTD